jgi:mandelate racemase
MAQSQPRLTLRAVRARAVEVPMTYVLGTSAAAVRAAPLLLVDVETEEGITGRTYLFCYTRAAAAPIAAMLVDAAAALAASPLDPALWWATLYKRYTLIGVQGIVRMAMAALDTACWDALAIAAGVPLATFLGSAPKAVAAYNSCGLGLMPPAALADEAEQLLAGGFRAMKLRLGYPTLREDLAALAAVRGRLGDAVKIMVDYNQALSVDEALLRGRALDEHALEWIEEPIRHDDYAGNARLAAALRTPLQIGENFSLPFAMQEALTRGACDRVMPDLERIGGVSGWQQAAALAQAQGMPMSSHLFPEVSAHLLAATPTAHWLEYVDWAQAIVEEPLLIAGGCAQLPSRPGNGLLWDEAAVAHHRLA